MEQCCTEEHMASETCGVYNPHTDKIPPRERASERESEHKWIISQLVNFDWNMRFYGTRHDCNVLMYVTSKLLWPLGVAGLPCRRRTLCSCWLVVPAVLHLVLLTPQQQTNATPRASTWGRGWVWGLLVSWLVRIIHFRTGE